MVNDSRFITRLGTWNMAVHFEKLQNPLPTIILCRGSIASVCQFTCNLNLLTQGKGKIKRCVKIAVDLQCTQIWYSSSKNGVWTRLLLLTNMLLMFSHQMLLIKEKNPVALGKTISPFPPLMLWWKYLKKGKQFSCLKKRLISPALYFYPLRKSRIKKHWLDLTVFYL